MGTLVHPLLCPSSAWSHMAMNGGQRDGWRNATRFWRPGWCHTNIMGASDTRKRRVSTFIMLLTAWLSRPDLSRRQCGGSFKRHRTSNSASSGPYRMSGTSELQFDALGCIERGTFTPSALRTSR